MSARLVLAAGVASACGSGHAREPGAAVTVELRAPGMTADQLERTAVVPVERALAGVLHTRAVRTVSVAGQAALAVDLAPGVDVFQTRSAITQRLTEATLPDGVDVSLGSLPARGELRYALRSRTASLAELRALHDHVIAPRLRAVEGVVDVAACGGVLATVEIAVHAERLRAVDVAPEDVASSVERGTAALGGGVLTRAAGDVVVRGQDIALDDLGALRVTAGADRAPILLRDVADIRDHGRLPSCHALLDGVTVV